MCTPSSGRGHAVIEADIAIQAAELLLDGGDERSAYSIGDRIAQAVMWTAFALMNVGAADAAFDELCARGTGDYDTPRREVPIGEVERASSRASSAAASATTWPTGDPGAKPEPHESPPPRVAWAGAHPIAASPSPRGAVDHRPEVRRPARTLGAPAAV